MKLLALASTLLSAAVATENSTVANETGANASYCMDANVQGAAEEECYSNVQWAMSDGWVRHKTWYEEKGITRNSTFADYQCALYLMKGQGAKNGISHGCLRPCDSTMDACAAPKETPVVEPKHETQPSVPTYVIVLVAVLLLAIAGAVAYMFMQGKKKGPSKKKRKVCSPAREAVVAEPAPVIPTTAVTTAPAIYLQTVQAPSAGSFVYTAQPQVAYTVPAAAQMALPTTATPVAYYTAQ